MRRDTHVNLWARVEKMGAQRLHMRGSNNRRKCQSTQWRLLRTGDLEDVPDGPSGSASLIIKGWPPIKRRKYWRPWPKQVCHICEKHFPEPLFAISDQPMKSIERAHQQFSQYTKKKRDCCWFPNHSTLIRIFSKFIDSTLISDFSEYCK